MARSHLGNIGPTHRVQAIRAAIEKEATAQMGKVSDARFNLDWRSPMSPLAAFGTALTVFDSKLGCSPAPPYLRAARPQHRTTQPCTWAPGLPVAG